MDSFGIDATPFESDSPGNYGTLCEVHADRRSLILLPIPASGASSFTLDSGEMRGLQEATSLRRRSVHRLLPGFFRRLRAAMLRGPAHHLNQARMEQTVAVGRSRHQASGLSLAFQPVPHRGRAALGAGRVGSEVFATDLYATVGTGGHRPNEYTLNDLGWPSRKRSTGQPPKTPPTG